jgi:hypothetical protein
MKREPINFSVSLDAHGAGADEIPIEHVAATAYRCVSLVQSLLITLSHVDLGGLQEMDSDDLSITFGHIGDIGTGLCDETLALIDILEDERQRLDALKVKKGGKR